MKVSRILATLSLRRNLAGTKTEAGPGNVSAVQTDRKRSLGPTGTEAVTEPQPELESGLKPGPDQDRERDQGRGLHSTRD